MLDKKNPSLLTTTMEERKTVLQFTKSSADIIATILKNVKKMLSNRIYIDSAGEKHPLLSKSRLNENFQDNEDETFSIELDNKVICHVRIDFHAVTSVGKQTPVYTFMNSHPDGLKILIAEDYNNKVIDKLIAQKVQAFRKSMFMEDILEMRDQPHFEILSPNEKKQVYKEYLITDQTTPKILRSDPIFKYFGMKVGDLLRIVRPSPTVGTAVTYRVGAKSN